MKISNNLEMSSMRALGLLLSKVSGFADSGGHGACSWVASGGGVYGMVSRDSTGTQEVVLQGVHHDRRDCQGSSGASRRL